MFCSHCGKQQPDGALFCTNCGSRLHREETLAAPAQAAPQATPTPVTPQAPPAVPYTMAAPAAPDSYSAPQTPYWSAPEYQGGYPPTAQPRGMKKGLFIALTSVGAAAALALGVWAGIGIAGII